MWLAVGKQHHYLGGMTMKDIKRYLFIMAAFVAVCGFVACGDGGGSSSSDGGSVRAQYGPADDGTTITFYGDNTFRLVEASGTSTRAADSEGGNVTITKGTYTGNPVTGDGLACTSFAGNDVTVQVSGGSATVNNKSLAKAVAVYEGYYPDKSGGIGFQILTFFTGGKVTLMDMLLGDTDMRLSTGTYTGNPAQNGGNITVSFTAPVQWNGTMPSTGGKLEADNEGDDEDVEFTRIYP